jgi:AcrR family transcriptional regulator
VQAAATTGRRERKRAENRARLIEAAVAVMLRDGYDRATIAEIAREADLGFGTFYSHFESKDAAFQAAIEEVGAVRLHLLEGALEGIDSVLERVATTCALFVQLAGRYPQATRFLLDARRRAENPGQDAAVHPFGDLVEEGCKSGELELPAPQATVAATAGAMFGLIHEMLEQRLQPDAAALAAADVSLRLLGLPPHEAHEVARRVFDNVDAHLRVELDHGDSER